jgi:hypothetical protein
MSFKELNYYSTLFLFPSLDKEGLGAVEKFKFVKIFILIYDREVAGMV